MACGSSPPAEPRAQQFSFSSFYFVLPDLRPLPWLCQQGGFRGFALFGFGSVLFVLGYHHRRQLQLTGDA
jgi:hypothetical protein